MSAAKTGKTHERQRQDPSQHQAERGSLADGRNISEFQLFAQSRHQGNRQCKAGPGADGIGQRLDEVVAFEGLEQRKAQNRAVGSDERQKNTERPEQTGRIFL